MPKQVQLRRGSTAQTAVFTGAQGEITVDTDKKTAVVHDGSTAGGFPLARDSEVLKKASNLSDISGETNRAAARANLDVPGFDPARGLLAARLPRPGLFLDGTSTSRLTGDTGVSLGLSDFVLAFDLTILAYPPAATLNLWASHSSVGNNLVSFALLANGNFYLELKNNSGVSSSFQFTPDLPLVAGRTYHVALACDRDSLATLYLNGITDRDKSGGGVSQNIAATSGIDIGAAGASGPWSCGISTRLVVHSLRVYNWLLSASEILSLAERGTVAFADQSARLAKIVDASTLNGGFETAGGGGGDDFASWTESESGSSTVTRDTAVFRSGAASCRFETDILASACSVIQNVLAIGKRHRLRLWAKHNGTPATLQVTFGSSATTQLVPLTSDWTQYEISGVADAVQLIVGRAFGETNRIFWVDDLELDQPGCLLDADCESCDPALSLALRDRAGNYHGNASATNTYQIARRPQICADRLALGSGRVVAKILSETASLDFGSIPAQSSLDLPITVNGVAVGDSVSLGPPASPTAGVIFWPFVSAVNTVTVRATNITAGAIDPAAQTFRATVFQFA